MPATEAELINTAMADWDEGRAGDEFEADITYISFDSRAWIEQWRKLMFGGLVSVDWV